MDIDKILDELIEKYDLDFGQIKLQNNAIFLIKVFLSQISKKAKIAIRGGGEHTKQLLIIIKELGYENNIKCIIDRNLKQADDMEYNFISIDDIDKYDIDTIIISSYRYREEMEMELYNLDNNYQIIDIYDYLYLNNIEIKQPFYLASAVFIYNGIFLYRKKYLGERDSKLKEFYLEKLISNYLDIRDFIYSIKYINIYIENKYRKYKIYEKFLQELNLLLDNIKFKLSQRNHKDIIMSWIDSLCYDELSQMEYLNKISKTSMFFQNAFTFTPWTAATMQVIMTNKKTIDNHLFKLKKIDIDNSCVLKLFKDNNYIFKYIGSFKNNFFKSNFSENNACDCSPYNNWLVLKNLILIDNPCFFIVHNLYETHEPCVSGEDTLINLKQYSMSMKIEEIDKFRKQKKLSALYLDKQIEWLDKFLGNKCSRIYMSDHGYEKLYKDRRLHTILFIKSTSINNILCKNMFSYLNFYQLFTYILEENSRNFEKIFTDFIEFQTTDIFREPLVDSLTQEDGKIFSISDAISFRGIRSHYDKYILYATGAELYFILPDENINQINNPKYKDRINELRNLIGDYFIDIYKNDKFKYSRKFYDILKKNNIDFLNEVINGKGMYTVY